ncbi:MAG TPA: hypothetical protein VH988_21420 [Thermoanaerobaculia bacterium]|jgi:hypothetical protein|nr:hypothetical protein [Thermoanaerobaculia bacterium]
MEYPQYMEHPEPERLEGLMRNELAGVERRRLIRHLLTGCPRCVKVTRRCWTLGSRPLAGAVAVEAGAGAGTADGSKLPE